MRINFRRLSETQTYVNLAGTIAILLVIVFKGLSIPAHAMPVD